LPAGGTAWGFGRMVGGGFAGVRNDDDPIPWWRPGLLVSPRAGPSWLPGGTFWQLTGGMVTSLDQPRSHGHGHRYGASLADDWSGQLVEPSGAVPRSPRQHDL
jgi:uncharacterized membrane protein